MNKIAIQRSEVVVNGLRMFYLDTATSVPVMLCLHGRWGRAVTWQSFINRYGDRYRIIAPDQRGHGLTDKPESGYWPADMADDAHALLKHLGCEKAIVVGHSMGGRIAAFVADRYPETIRALAILDVSAAKPGDGPLTPDDDGLTKGWPTPFATYQDAIDFLRATFERETNVRYFADSLVETRAGYDFMFSRAAMAALERAQVDWMELLPRFKCPVCLVRAGRSVFFTAEDAQRMRSLIPDCTYFEVDDSDHMVYEDDREQFYAGFDKFLSRIP